MPIYFCDMQGTYLFIEDVVSIPRKGERLKYRVSSNESPDKINLYMVRDIMYDLQTVRGGAEHSNKSCCSVWVYLENVGGNE